MKILKNITWTFSSNLFSAISKWLVLVIIANILSPLEVGIYSLAFAISAPITLFANMKLRSLYITDKSPDFFNYVSGRNILSGLAIILLLSISIIFYPSYILIIMIVGLSKILDLQSDIYYALPHNVNDMDIIGKLMIVKNIIMLAVFSFTLILSQSLTLSLIMQLIIQLAFVFLVEKKLINAKYPTIQTSFSFKAVKKILVLGLPLGVVQMVVSLKTNVPRYFLEFYESAEVLGYYSALAYILTVGNLMMSAVSQNFLPNLSRKIKDKQYSGFKNNILYLSLFSIVLGLTFVIFSVFWGEVFLGFVYGPEYAEYSDVLIIMSVAILVSFVGWIYDTGLMALRYISIQPKVSLVSLIISVLISFILVEKYGIYGVTFTLIIANVIQLLLRMYFLHRRLTRLN